MFYLSFVTLLWAFSFSLIGVYLAGSVDMWFSAWIRVAIAMVFFLPFIKLRGFSLSLRIKLLAIGAVQLGSMYCFYYQSFLLLTVPEVLLFTVFTPIYITVIYDLLHKRFSPWYLTSAGIAVLGAVIIKSAGVSESFLLGFAVVQGANISFALGQVAYKTLMEKQKETVSHKTAFAYFYLGAFIVVSIAYLMLGNSERLPTTNLQWGILVYLGAVASGVGYFLWNRGACQVNSGTLAVMNNALVPAGLIVNLVIWNKQEDISRLLLGGMIILASLWISEYKLKKLG